MDDSTAARILIVDDEPTVVDVLTHHLQRRGCVVRAAGSCEEARQEMAEHEFDVVLLDNGLPAEMGISVLAEFVEKGRGAAVIMITGGPNEDIEKDALLLGAKGFLAKPFDYCELDRLLGLYSRP